MNQIERAEMVLTAARVRHPTSCLPGTAESPADSLGTLTLSADLIAECDRAARRRLLAATVPGDRSGVERVG